MLILSRIPKTEKQRFRVKAVLSTRGEISYVEVSEVDENLLKRGRELHRKWCRRSSSGADGASMSNPEKEREIFMRAAMQLLNDELVSFQPLSSNSDHNSSSHDLQNLHQSHISSTSFTLVHPNTLLSSNNNNNNNNNNINLVITTEPQTTSKAPRSTYDFFHRRAVALRSLLRSSQSLTGGHPLRALSLSQRIPREESFRYGWLQKACRPSHLSAVGQRATGEGLWKAKYAELRYSEFIYYEEEYVTARPLIRANSSGALAAGQGLADHLPVSSSFSPDTMSPDITSTHHPTADHTTTTGKNKSNSSSSKCKRIALSAETCVCRVIKMRDMPCDQGQGDCVFELSIRGAARRIWQAGG